MQWDKESPSRDKYDHDHLDQVMDAEITEAWLGNVAWQHGKGRPTESDRDWQTQRLAETDTSRDWVAG